MILSDMSDNPKILEDRTINVPVVVPVLFNSVDNVNKFFESQQ